MMRAIRVHQFGGPEALTLEDVPVPEPGPGEVLIKIRAAGVNYIDVYHRIGRYANPLPITPGVEAAGQVEAVGAGVGEVRAGDRVGYVLSLGGYADYAVVPVARLVPLPDSVDDRSAAAALIQGMTAQLLARDCYALQAGQTALVHAAAGGVGLLLTQIAKKRGARVIATVSTAAKAALAREAGADEVVLYSQVDFEAEVKRITQGAGVHVVYDSVGQTTFEKSLNCLRPRGFLVLYGSASGPAPMLDPNGLGGKGSLYVTRPSIYHYTPDRASLLALAAEVLGRVAAGDLRLRVEHVYALADAAQAHRDLEARRTSGKLLLIPE